MKKFKFKIVWLFSLWLLISLYAFADPLDELKQSQTTNILPPSQGFGVGITTDPLRNILVSFNISPGYYIYRDRLIISINGKILPTSKLPQGLIIQVPEINAQGRLITQAETVLSGDFIVKIPSNEYTLIENLPVKVTLQGCDGKSICYPPQKYSFILNVSNKQTDQIDSSKNFFTYLQALSNSNMSDSGIIASLNIFELIAIFFCAGVLISLTPCMYPLYPVALTAILGNNTSSKTTSLTVKLVLCYIHGIALIYVILGVIAAFSGKLLATVLQTPYFMLTSSIILLILGLAMFDLVNITLPNKLHNYLQSKTTGLNNGKYTTAFVLGVLSSIVLGPCITPPLIVAIGFIAHQGSILLGILGLYAIALGLGVPILVLAILGNKLLPKSGAWMLLIKYILGALIIIASIYLAYPFINLGNKLINIGIIFFFIALITLIIKHLRSRELEHFIHDILPVAFIILGLIFTISGIKALSMLDKGLIQGNNQKNTVDRNGFQIVTSKTVLEQLINQSKQPVIIDIYARWCATCNEMEAKTFSDKELQQRLTNYTKIKFDITENSKEDYQVLQQYGLYGPPAIIILDQQQQVVDKLVGFTSSGKLMQYLEN